MGNDEHSENAERSESVLSKFYIQISLLFILIALLVYGPLLFSVIEDSIFSTSHVESFLNTLDCMTSMVAFTQQLINLLKTCFKVK